MGGEDFGVRLVSPVPWFLCVESAEVWGGRVVDSEGGHHGSLDFVLVLVVWQDAQEWRLVGRSGN